MTTTAAQTPPKRTYPVVVTPHTEAMSDDDGRDDASSMPSFDNEDDHSLKQENELLKAEVEQLKRQLYQVYRGKGKIKRKISGDDPNSDFEMEPLNHRHASGLHHRHQQHHLMIPKRSPEMSGLLLQHSDDDDLEAAPPVQPLLETLTFWESVCDRAGWLVGLLILQSLSSFIIKHNEALLTHHGVIVQFLTMLVGAGGNAGNQATVKGECLVDGSVQAIVCTLVIASSHRLVLTLFSYSYSYSRFGTGRY